MTGWGFCPEPVIPSLDKQPLPRAWGGRGGTSQAQQPSDTHPQNHPGHREAGAAPRKLRYHLGRAQGPPCALRPAQLPPAGQPAPLPRPFWSFLPCPLFCLQSPHFCPLVLSPSVSLSPSPCLSSLNRQAGAGRNPGAAPPPQQGFGVGEGGRGESPDHGPSLSLPAPTPHLCPRSKLRLSPSWCGVRS